MGTFHAKGRVENPFDRARSATVSKLLVDTWSELTWVPEATLERIGVRREKKDVAFTRANGETVTRSVGFAIIRLERHFTIDEVVFAQPGDLSLLGARTLEGLNLTIDPARRRLVAAGHSRRPPVAERTTDTDERGKRGASQAPRAWRSTGAEACT